MLGNDERTKTNSSFTLHPLNSENQRRSSFLRARAHRAEVPNIRASARLQRRQQEEKQEEMLRPISSHRDHLYVSQNKPSNEHLLLTHNQDFDQREF